MDRRTSLKWMLAASAAMPLMTQRAFGQSSTVLAQPKPSDALGFTGGYGSDPDMVKIYHPGDVWPLTFTKAQRREAAALCDLIIPADEVSPSASSVGVVDFLDEWVSAPYPRQREDRATLLPGLQWLDEEATRRAGKLFADAESSVQHAICSDICYEAAVAPPFKQAAKFFACFRDLTAGGFYTTPIGMKDIGYIGNVPRTEFPGPPLALLEELGLRPTLK
jgi:Gluconate 2-dehydrogenase subunit 3